MERNKLKLASFFAGIGGFDIAFENAGVDVVFQCEINPFSQKVLKSHWPMIPLFPNILDLTPDDIPDAEIWAGGFPCQDLSLANQGKRKGLEGERSGLFYKYSELIKAKKPRWVITENVPGLLNSHGGDDFKIVIDTLEKLGYCVSWRVLDAKYFGTPQRRRRVYLVASLRNAGSAFVLFEPGTLDEVYRSGIGKKDFVARKFPQGIGKEPYYLIQHATIGRKSTAGPQAKGFRNDGEAYTLDSRGSADVVCSTTAPFRMREIAGISKGMDSNRYRAIGNAVCVNVVSWIANRIVYVDNKLKI